MRDRENIKELLDYLQTSEEKALDFDEESIVRAYEKNIDQQSLPIKLLSIFGGLLASLAFLGFLFMIGLIKSEPGMLVFGTLCIAGAIWINKAYDKIIIDTVSVSSFIIGFIVLALVINNVNLACFTFILIAFCSLGIVQNYILSFISVLIINGSILTLIISNNNYELIHIYVSILALLVSSFFLKEASIIKAGKAFSKLYNPVRIGLIFSFLSGLVFLGKKGLIPLSPSYIWVSSIITLSAIVYLIYVLLNTLNITSAKHKAFIYIFSILILATTALSPAISGAMLIILLSFLVNYKTGLALGIITFIYFVSQYYYDLNFTLLTKSLLLFSSGVLFLVFYLFTNKKLTANEKI